MRADETAVALFFDAGGEVVDEEKRGALASGTMSMSNRHWAKERQGVALVSL